MAKSVLSLKESKQHSTTLPILLSNCTHNNNCFM